MMKELYDISKQNPFKVPEGYFENLTERVISQTSAIEPLPQKKSIIRKLRPYLAVAASVALLALIGYSAIYFGMIKHKTHANEMAVTEKYSNNYLNDIDISTLEENVAGNETYEEIPLFNKNEIIDYLISDNINILDIYEQF